MGHGPKGVGESHEKVGIYFWKSMNENGVKSKNNSSFIQNYVLFQKDMLPNLPDLGLLEGPPSSDKQNHLKFAKIFEIDEKICFSSQKTLFEMPQCVILLWDRSSNKLMAI